MSRKEDIVFCKIALTNGLITQEAAQKALALCDKREKEGGRRPLIGALFTKYNLMNNQEVQRIYTAVQKRLGTTVGPQIPAARGRGGRGARGGRGHARESKHDRRSKPSRPIDPKTLWMGIGGIVVFLGIMVVLVLMVLSPSETPEEGGPGVVSPTEGGGGAAAVPGGGSGGSTTGGGATGPSVRGMSDSVKDQVDQKITDARSEKSTKAEEYLSSLNVVKKQLADKGYPPYERLEAAIREMEEAVAAQGASAREAEGEGGGEETGKKGEEKGETTESEGAATELEGDLELQKELEEEGL